MVNAYQKGLRNKRKAKQYLRDNGFEVADVEDNRRNSRETDKFGVADLMACHNGKWFIVQVTSNHPKTRAKMQRVATRLQTPTLCLTWIDNEGFRVQAYKPGCDATPSMDFEVDSSEVLG